ncbi:hypothetical protein V1477_000578 [Vespula maculifrons]|uniref:Uncharacterized protein n=1 Tax=Vespula maculifrons TaxID=7453 RepID=A0ABD2D3C3_VESMC
MKELSYYMAEKNEKFLYILSFMHVHNNGGTYYISRHFNYRSGDTAVSKLDVARYIKRRQTSLIASKALV